MTVQTQFHLARELARFMDESGLTDPHEVADAFVVTLPEAILRELVRTQLLPYATRRVQSRQRGDIASAAKAGRETTVEAVDKWVVNVPGAGFRLLLDCTPQELDRAAQDLDRKAWELSRRADVYRSVAGLTKTLKAATPREVDRERVVAAIAEALQ